MKKLSSFLSDLASSSSGRFREKETTEPCPVEGAAGKGVSVVGLTGGIGSGKSEAGRLFAGLGATVVDADALGHEALRDPEVKARLVAHFGDILDGSGEIDRRRLGAAVFADPASRQALEAVSHPFIARRMQEIVASAPSPLVVLDAALLYEAGWDAACDRVVFIDAPRETRLSRVRTRSGWSEEQLAAREAAQLPLTEKRARADHVIDNSSTRDELLQRIVALMEEWGAPLPLYQATEDR